MSDLKPCPFCESANVHAYTYKDAVYRQYAVKCKKCGARIMAQSTELAIEKWNRRADTERTAKAIEHDASVTDTDGYKYHRSEYLCGACKKRVLGGDEYCSHCGAKLDWSE